MRWRNIVYDCVDMFKGYLYTQYGQGESIETVGARRGRRHEKTILESIKCDLIIIVWLEMLLQVKLN